MAFSTDIAGQGVLTGTPTIDTVRTSNSNETHRITFRNTGGSDVTLELYINGTSAQNRLGSNITVVPNGGCVLTLDLGNGDDVRALSSLPSVVVWTDEMVVLT